MTSNGSLRVSSRGQMSLPSSARHRWNLDQGGDLAYLDLGVAILLVPNGPDALRRELLELVGPEDWQAARDGFGDPDLASE